MNDTRFSPIDPLTLGNAFAMIGDDWMLITAKKPDGTVNTMTASWGFMGVLWGMPVCAIFVRPQRYTKEFIDAADSLSLSFFSEEYRPALRLCGTKSGRELDKIAKAGLTTVFTEDGVPYFREADTVLVGHKIYSDLIKPESFLDTTLISKNYPRADFHHIYLVALDRAYKKGD